MTRFLEAVAKVFRARSWGSWLRESAEEVAAVSGPYETFGDDQVTFVVDLEAAVVHQPRPGSFDDPAFGEDREPMSVDTVHDFDGDVVGTAVLDEGLFEPGVAPQAAEPVRPRALAASATLVPPVLSEVLATTVTANSNPRVSTIPNVLRPEIFFPAS